MLISGFRLILLPIRDGTEVDRRNILAYAKLKDTCTLTKKIQ